MENIKVISEKENDVWIDKCLKVGNHLSASDGYGVIRTGTITRLYNNPLGMRFATLRLEPPNNNNNIRYYYITVRVY